MTIVNASAATEAVNITLVSDQFAFDARDPGGVNGPNDYSWRTIGGDDVQASGSGIDSAGDPPAFGLIDRIDIDLSDNSFSNPDVTITSITPNGLGGALGDALLTVITNNATDFFNELMSYDDTLIGSDFDDTMKGGGGDDDLSLGDGDDFGYGDAGDDVISGEDGEDTLYGGSGDDTLDGGADDDALYGGADDDALEGGGDDDTLYGGTGTDDMDGGLGNDVYVVDDAGDTAAEVAGGTDRVDASVTHALSANMENLTLTGAAAVSGTGNFRANVINGNSANNSLFGGSGNDTMNGGAGADIMNGGTGADVMAGGSGNDVYVVDNAGDAVVEGVALGIDRVQSSVSDALGANVENLTLTGAAAINGIGNGLGNVITGNGANNALLGLTGADTLIGGGGADVLNGGAGDDILRGGAGADVLVGGLDDDTFDFDLASDSGPAAAARDVINGFDVPGPGIGDIINLATIDADVTAASPGDDAFTFLGVIQAPNPPATPAGSMWMRAEAGGETVVYCNTDGDIAAEMAIRIADGAVTPFAYSGADFIL